MLRRPRPREWSRLSALSALRFTSAGRARTSVPLAFSALRFTSAGRARTSVPLAFLRPSVLWLTAWVDLVGGMAWTTDVGHAVTMLAGPGKRQHLRQPLSPSWSGLSA